MAHRPKRATVVRAAVGLAALASPLLATGVAQAAIAGAQPAKASATPVLKSATIDASSPNALDVCFDKSILPNSNNNFFEIGGYRAGNGQFQSSQAQPLGSNCAKVFFSVADLSQYTVLNAAQGAVSSSGGGNNADSVGITGSTSHAGTRGNTTPPDLAGIQPSTSSSSGNQYIYVFNKAVSPTNLTAADFYIVTPGGNEVDGNSASPVSGTANEVAVTFATATAGGQATNNAFLGGVRQGAVVAQYDSSVPNVNESSLVPYSSNQPGEFAPYVTGAALNKDNQSITYTFNQGVEGNPASANNAPVPADFKAELANGVIVTANSVNSTGGNSVNTTTVTANFGTALSDQAEFGVIAWAERGAVGTYTSNGTTGEPSAASSAPIGDNSGAFARAFTSAPDVYGITITKGANNGSVDQLAINLDDRIQAYTAADIVYYDSTGAKLATQPAPTGCTVTTGTTTAAPSITTARAAGPGAQTLTCSYPLGSLNNVAAVGFLRNAFQGLLTSATPTPANGGPTGLSDGDEFSIDQIVSPVSSAAILKAYRTNIRHAKAHKHHKHHRKHHGRRTHKKH